MDTQLRIATLVLVTSVTLHGEDWPQFRGPTGQGHSTERGLPVDWSETQNIAWKTPVPGIGWSSPVVAGGRVWLTTSIDTGTRLPINSSLRVLAFDAASGKEVVNVEVFRNRSAGYINPKNSRASPTPILDGDRVYVHFGAEGTAARRLPACLAGSGIERDDVGLTAIAIAVDDQQILIQRRRSAVAVLRLIPQVRRPQNLA